MDRKKFKLTIELIPSTVWFSSLYNLYEQSGQSYKWRKIKDGLFAEEGRQCWICGDKGRRLEAHEFWKYDDKNHVQKLVAIHHLCDICHKIKHIGFWCHTDDGKEQLQTLGLTRDDLITHFCKVNNCSVQEFDKYQAKCFALWAERSMHEWKQDLGKYELSRITKDSA